MAERVHDAYCDVLDGGHRGYQGACWDCDWRGPERLRGDEEMGTEGSRAHKENAKLDAMRHRETAPQVPVDETEALRTRAEQAEQALHQAREQLALADELAERLNGAANRYRNARANRKDHQ